MDKSLSTATRNWQHDSLRIDKRSEWRGFAEIKREGEMEKNSESGTATEGTVEAPSNQTTSG